MASPFKKWLVPAGGWLLPLPSRVLAAAAAAGILLPVFVPAQLCPAGSWHRVPAMWGLIWVTQQIPGFGAAWEQNDHWGLGRGVGSRG